MAESPGALSGAFSRRGRACALVLAATICLAGCGAGISQHDFVGKWLSSRNSRAIHLHDNGEWEIVSDDDKILEYGIWRYQNGVVVWTYNRKAAGTLHDRNPVLSVTPNEFRLREEDGTTTTFTRLE